MNRRTEYLSYIKGQLWGIIPGRLDAMIKKSDMADQSQDEKTLREKYPKAFEKTNGYGYEKQGAVAVIDIEGVIEKKHSLWSWVFGGISSEMIRKDIESALKDTGVDAILLNIDSPGGTVDGTKELSDFIHSVRGQKPIVALTDGLMASAAYYIGSAADKIYASDLAQVGHIGVIQPHIDWSQALSDEGIKVTLIHAGKFKTVGNPYEPLSDEARAVIQAEVDNIYGQFVQDVARNRGVAIEYAAENMADARLFFGKDAPASNMTDGIATKQELISEMNKELQNTNLKSKEQNMSIFSKPPTVEAVKKDAPDVAQALIAEGRAEAEKSFAEKTEAAKVEAKNAMDALNATHAAEMAAERKRSQDILSLATPDQSKLAMNLIAAGKTVSEATLELLKDAQAAKTKALAEFAANAAKKDPPAGEQVNGEATAILAKYESDKKFAGLYASKGGKPALEAALAEWSAKADVREEFGGNVEKFLSYKRNSKEKE